jgi:hypothetical protein
MLKRIEIKEFGIFSAFKSTIYLSIIPCVLIGLLGILFIVIGAVLGEEMFFFIGLPYFIMPLNKASSKNIKFHQGGLKLGSYSS